MNENTLKRTGDQMYQSAQAIAEKQEKQAFGTKDLQKVLGVAKTIFGENDVIQGMETGEALVATDYTQKLAILKAQLEEAFLHKSKR